MKQLITALSFILLAFLISSCGCNIECADCETLDEENCECVVDIACQCSDGIQNGNETGIDCGGDCDACFDCLTDNCIFLSGGTSSEGVTHKKWIFVYEDFLPTKDLDWTDTYYSNGFFVGTSNETTVNGSWKFDNPSLPTAIIITMNENAPAGWSPGVPTTYPLVKLTSDTLRYKNPTFNYTMLLLPE